MTRKHAPKKMPPRREPEHPPSSNSKPEPSAGVKPNRPNDEPEPQPEPSHGTITGGPSGRTKAVRVRRAKLLMLLVGGASPTDSWKALKVSKSTGSEDKAALVKDSAIRRVTPDGSTPQFYAPDIGILRWRVLLMELELWEHIQRDIPPGLLAQMGTPHIGASPQGFSNAGGDVLRQRHANAPDAPGVSERMAPMRAEIPSANAHHLYAPPFFSLENTGHYVSLDSWKGAEYMASRRSLSTGELLCPAIKGWGPGTRPAWFPVDKPWTDRAKSWGYVFRLSVPGLKKPIDVSINGKDRWTAQFVLPKHVLSANNALEERRAYHALGLSVVQEIIRHSGAEQSTIDSWTINTDREEVEHPIPPGILPIGLHAKTQYGEVYTDRTLPKPLQGFFGPGTMALGTRGELNNIAHLTYIPMTAELSQDRKKLHAALFHVAERLDTLEKQESDLRDVSRDLLHSVRLLTEQAAGPPPPPPAASPSSSASSWDISFA